MELCCLVFTQLLTVSTKDQGILLPPVPLIHNQGLHLEDPRLPSLFPHGDFVDDSFGICSVQLSI